MSANAIRTTPAASAVADTPVPSSHERHAELRAMLQDRQREMLQVLQDRIRHAPSGVQTSGLDETEHAEAEIQEHIDVALIQMKGDTLQKVREALVRLESGEYGICDECECEISARRLQALPFAVRCRPCEEMHERRAAQERRTRSNFELL